MLPSHLLGVFFAFSSAVVWGSGDFCGGLATRRGRPFPVTALVSVSGVVLLWLVAWLRGEAWPGPAGIAWSLAAGASGMIGIAALYRGLSIGRASLVAPTAAVIGAAVTLLAGAALEGLPRPLQAAGLLLGLAGIWLVSRQPEIASDLTGFGKPVRSSIFSGAFGMAVLAGLAFGGFFVFIAQVERGLIFSPLVLAKGAALALSLLLAAWQRDPLESPFRNPIALAAGVLDAGGNIFYLLAHQFTRLDVSAVLAAMYPASTVILSALVLHQHLNRSQTLGLLLCLAALALIAV